MKLFRFSFPKISNLIIFFLAGLLYSLLSSPVLAVDCNVPMSGNITINTACSFPGTVNGVDTGTGSVNTAVITMATGGTLTIQASQTVASGSLSLTGGSIVIIDTGQIKVGMPLWMTDCDADGYAAGGTQYVQTGAPACGRRRNLMSTLTTDCNDNKNYRTTECPPWYNASWAYRDEVTVTNSGSSGLSNYQMLYQVNTASLVSAGRLQADCDDLRFSDSNGTTLLTYWIEAGCNTTNTQIWITVPSIPIGSKRIFMYYSNGVATAGTQSWTGSFVTLSNASCPSGFTRFTTLDSRFPQGSATYGGTGDSSTHTHTYSFSSGTYSGSLMKGLYTSDCYGGCYAYPPIGTGHYHTVSGTTGSAGHTPPYLNMIYCSSSAPAPLLSTSLIVLGESVFTGFTRFTLLDSKFPQGAATYGGTGGSSTHTHSFGGNNTGGPQDTTRYSRINLSCTSDTHTHSVSSGTTGSAGGLPPYLNMIFESRSATGPFVEGAISIITTALPPQGWTRFASLDSKFPQGAATYGGTGGSSTHTGHSISGTTGSASGLASKCDSWTSNVPNLSHTHSFSGSTGSANHTPPYLNVIFGKRNGSSPTTSVPISGEPYPP